MEKHENVFKEFVSFDNLYKGYLTARRNKRFHKDVLEFSANLEENLIDLQNRLIWKTYKVDRISEFVEYYPKKRIITVMPFENRVVNCAAYNVLFPIYRRSMYEHSYGSIPGKGALKAVEQLQYWIRLVRNKPGKWYMCKMDISKFFFRIPTDVQLKYLKKPLNDSDMEWFLKTAIECDGRPFGLPVNAVDVTECERIPGIGMQVGSLISQMTANVVMTPADHYIKRVLQAPYYLRYMDDMIFFAPSKLEAEGILRAFSKFLFTNLGLELNSKTAVMPANHAVEFVGKIVTADSIKIRKSTSLQMKHRLKWIMENYTNSKISQEYALQVSRSYLGLMKHCDCTALRNKICADFKLVRHGQN